MLLDIFLLLFTRYYRQACKFVNFCNQGIYSILRSILGIIVTVIFGLFSTAAALPACIIAFLLFMRR
jgi:uncharacterized membrane protein